MNVEEKLYPYQQDGVDALKTILQSSETRSALLADAPGVGKTPQAVRLAVALKATRILVVCPASLRINWLRELARWSGGRYRGQTLESSKDEATGDVLIISYSLAARNPAVGPTGFDLVIFDESHALKSPGAKATRACLIDIWNRSTYRLCLTGTPVPNGRASEAFSVFMRMAPKVFSPWPKYCKRYCVEAPNPHDPRPGAVWYPGSRNLDELGRLAREHFMVRRTRSVVADQLPPVARERFYLDVPELRDAETARGHDPDLAPLFDAALIDRIVAAVNGGRDASPLPRESDPLSTARRKLGALKAHAAVGFLEDLAESGTKRVVVFCHHRDVYGSLFEGLLNSKGFDEVWGISGGMSGEDRQAMVDAFQSMQGTERTGAFVASISAASTGLTLTAADTVVFVEYDWVPSTNEQAEARVARLTQRSAVCRAIYLVVPDTLDEAVLGCVLKKSRDIEAVMAA